MTSAGGYLFRRSQALIPNNPSRIQDTTDSLTKIQRLCDGFAVKELSSIENSLHSPSDFFETSVGLAAFLFCFYLAQMNFAVFPPLSELSPEIGAAARQPTSS